jgi:hypothetical protein
MLYGPRPQSRFRIKPADPEPRWNDYSALELSNLAQALWRLLKEEQIVEFTAPMLRYRLAWQMNQAELSDRSISLCIRAAQFLEEMHKDENDWHQPIHSLIEELNSYQPASRKRRSMS